jgi:DnaJ-class molecular chaperone
MDLKELTNLHAESQVQKLKASQSKHQMTPNQGLQVTEARDLIALRNNALNKQARASSSSTLGPSAPPKQAPPTCSKCNTKGHTRTRCPNHY